MHYRYTRDCSQALVLLFGRVAAGNFWEIFHTTTDSWAALESPGLTKHQAVRRFRLRLNGPLPSPSAPSCLLNASADRILSHLDATVSGGMLPMRARLHWPQRPNLQKVLLQELGGLSVFDTDNPTGHYRSAPAQLNPA